ncbi:MAG: hypothetical protein Q7V57_19330 [Actinomycetota bacterium]|nr:hypothetical protein [Actinomycetota bacterium]
MPTSLRNATEHALHTLNGLVDDARQHIELPHIELPHIDLPYIDLARFARRRRSLSLATIVSIVVGVLLAAFAVRAIRGRQQSDSGRNGLT